MQPEFRTSSFCSSSACVEAGVTPEGVWVRDSKDQSKTLWFDRDEWQAFVQGVKAGEFDA